MIHPDKQQQQQQQQQQHQQQQQQQHHMKFKGKISLEKKANCKDDFFPVLSLKKE
jgi:hypothetical protein